MFLFNQQYGITSVENLSFTLTIINFRVGFALSHTELSKTYQESSAMGLLQNVLRTHGLQ